MKKFILGALLATAAAAPATAQQNMYLVKDNHLVAKYDVDAVDYVAFTLPDDVSDAPLWVEVGNVGKNTVSYSVKVIDPAAYYVHALASYHVLNNYAMSYYSSTFDDLPAGTQKLLLERFLNFEGAYLGAGNQTYTMIDFEDDGTGYGDYVSRFSVRAGNDYFVVAAPYDAQADVLDTENMVIQKVSTPAPGKTSLPLSVKYLGDEGGVLNFDFTGTSAELKYVLVMVLPTSSLDFYRSYYGYDDEYMINAWGTAWPVATLMEGAKWEAYESGNYTMVARGVDGNGDIVDATCSGDFTAPNAGTGPEITIFSKSKDNNTLVLNFEVNPSNVEECYYYIDTENNVDDAVNDGWALYEIASRSTAVDVTSQINSAGEYTINQEITSEQWQSLLIYAKDADGGRTVCRVNFNMDPDTRWSIENPAEDTNASRAAAKKVKIKNPVKRSLKKV